ncbi:MAG: fused response regulator/phosphatase [Gammaproteobacteria bacterium]|nr:fused response regulator/phosphatase [Gammaproteobacteria bacterium]
MNSSHAVTGKQKTITKDSNALKVLVADDDVPNRLILQAILEKQGYQVLLADDGQQAVDIFRSEQPDLVLMDIKMPKLDGYEATQEIKSISGDTFVPVIFLTATTDSEGLAKCVASGGDDFLTKPYNRVLLQARIDALLRIRELYNTTQQQRNELARHQKRLDRERQLAKRLFNNILETGALDLPYIKSMLSPMSLFSGDILMVAEKPSGGLHVLLGDFTGHGLAAAIGALPVSSVFYGMTAKGYSIAEIVTEINIKLTTILPTDMFLAACVVDINPGSHTMSVWNGGIPAVFIYGEEEQEIVRTVPSQHLPLGVIGNESFNRQVDVIEMRQHDRIFIHSDGITETANPAGEMFGSQRLEKIFVDSNRSEDLFDDVRAALASFTAGADQHDDMTLIEIQYDQPQLEATIHQDNGEREADPAQPSATWSLSMQLGARLMSSFDPLPLLIKSVCDMQGLRGQRQQLYTVFSELFSNALDHGILGLDSKLKQTADGFAKYYMERAEKLATLSEGNIIVDISHQPDEDGGVLTIRFEDSGRGFDYEKGTPSLESNLGHSGRGIQLLHSICDDITYENKGNVVTATYRWS